VIKGDKFSGRVLGIHLEGPFISDQPGAVGCHQKQHVRAPTVEFFQQLLVWAEGTVKLLTLAAEYPGAEAVTRFAVSHGITVSLGHQTASDADIKRLASCGATMLTHLGNGAPSPIHRHLNPIWSGLAEKRLCAGVITDGYHLPPQVIASMYRAKGARSMVIVSDVAAVAGLPPGIYPCMGKEVRVCDDGSVREVDGPRLAGSGSTMLMCLNHMAQLGLCSLQELEMLVFYNPLRMIHVDPAAIRTVVPRQLVTLTNGQFCVTK